MLNKFLRKKDYITFTIPQKEGPIEVSVNFGGDTNVDRYGSALSVISKGIMENTIQNAITEFAKVNRLDDAAEKILLEMENHSKEIDDLFGELESEEDFIAEVYPIIPAWGNPELSSLFDPESISDDPRKIMWTYLEPKEDSDGDEIDDDSEEESEHDGPQKNLYAVDGMPGLLNESQFRRLQDSGKPNYTMPLYETWVGYTNFNLGLNSYTSIANSNGVEYIKIVGRYSFVIAIGKMFEFGVVRREIEERLVIEYSKHKES